MPKRIVTTTTDIIDKGWNMEENLRIFFNRQGIFSIRGVPYMSWSDIISDIDLLLYIKASTISRELVNVDIKYKKRSSVRERIIWAKGIREALSLDRCIVATNDNTPLIRQFAENNKVILINGNFLNTIKDALDKSNRIPEENLINIIQPSRNEIGTRNEERLKRYYKLKSQLLKWWNFTTLNFSLQQVHYFMEQSLIESPLQQCALRLMYISMSYFTLIIDYLQLRVLFIPENDKKNYYLNGLVLGEDREKHMAFSEKILAFKWISFTADELYGMVTSQELSKFKILIDYLINYTFLNQAFNLAVRLEGISFSKNEEDLFLVETGVMNLVYMFADYFWFDRRKLPMKWIKHQNEERQQKLL